MCNLIYFILALYLFAGTVEIDTVGPVHGMNSDFYVNFCNASLDAAPCNPSKPSHVCAVEASEHRRYKEREGHRRVGRVRVEKSF